MDRLTHRVAGLAAMRARIAALSAATQTAAAVTLGDLADDAAEDLRLVLQHDDNAGPSGRSLPGTPPADPKGRIAAAVNVVREAGRASAVVTVDLPFARDLEFGTISAAPRPFLRPAMLRAGGKAAAALGAAARGVLSPLKGSSP